MAAERHELHQLVDELPEEQLVAMLADASRRLRGAGQGLGTGVIRGRRRSGSPADPATGTLAASGFGRDSL